MSFPCSIGGSVSGVTPDNPRPNLCLIPSSSNPDRLALCFFIGLPITDSRGSEVLGSNEALLSNVGGVERIEAFGGVVPAVGVLEAGDFRVAGDPAFTGSEECCRFSYVVCQSLIRMKKGEKFTLIFWTPSASSP